MEQSLNLFVIKKTRSVIKLPSFHIKYEDCTVFCAQGIFFQLQSTFTLILPLIVYTFIYYVSQLHGAHLFFL